MAVNVTTAGCICLWQNTLPTDYMVVAYLISGCLIAIRAR